MNTLTASVLATTTFAWGNGDYFNLSFGQDKFWGNRNHQSRDLDLDDEYDQGRRTRGYRNSSQKDGRSYALENADHWGLDFGEQNRRRDDNLNTRDSRCLTDGSRRSYRDSRNFGSADDCDDRSYDSDYFDSYDYAKFQGAAFLDSYGNSYGNNYYDGYGDKPGNNYG